MAEDFIHGNVTLPKTVDKKEASDPKAGTRKQEIFEDDLVVSSAQAYKVIIML